MKIEKIFPIKEQDSSRFDYLGFNSNSNLRRDGGIGGSIKVIGFKKEWKSLDNMIEVEKRKDEKDGLINYYLIFNKEYFKELCQKVAEADGLPKSIINNLSNELRKYNKSDKPISRIHPKQDNLIRKIIKNPKTYVFERFGAYPVIYVGNKRVIACAPTIRHVDSFN